jgi:hypothetical protein
MRYTASRASWSILLCVVALATAACPGGGGESPDARPPVDATAPPDAAPADAAPATGSGHPGAALVPAGSTSRSAGYRFVGTLTPGTPAASPGHTVRTGVAGATQ